MKLVKQTKLRFKKGNSDKVYEVDLCESGNGLYLVNFRFGRFGATLTTGTKTTSPVEKNKAEKLFDKLVESKTKKGYVDTSAAAPVVMSAPLPAMPQGADDRERAILQHLALGVSDPAAQAKKNWKISRVMWRAGELRIKGAVPYLLQLHDKGGEMHNYCAVWAIGRCGSDAAAAPILQHYMKGAYPDHIKHIAAAALLDILQGDDKQALLRDLIATMPPVFRNKIQENDASGFKGILNEFLNARKTKKFDFLVNAYLISESYPYIRKALAEGLKTAPFKPPFFKMIRAIFKLSEYRGDGQIYGMLAYRFEKEYPMYRKPGYSTGVWAGGSWIANVENELKKSNSRIAYSADTKDYINRRVWRWLNKLTAEEDENYVSIAAGILLSYEKKDYSRPSKDVRWNYNKKTRRYDKKTTHYDSYSNSLLLNHILYANSPRYSYMKDRKRWQCVNDYRPGMPAPTEREEALPHLWDKQPHAYIHLMAESDVDKIHEFAMRAFKQHPQYKALTERIGPDLLVRFIDKDYKPTALWGLDLAKSKYSPKKPNRRLTLALIGCKMDEARALGKQWISDNYGFYFSNTDFVLSMMTHQYADMREWAKTDMPKISGHLKPQQRQVLVGRVIAYLLGLDQENPRIKNATIRNHAEILTANFSHLLRKISFDVIRDLFSHPLEENRKFAGQLTLSHQTDAEELPVDLFNSFLNSKEAEMRKIGIQLFGQFSDNSLLGRQDELINYAISKLADVRSAVRPVIKRLAGQYASFAEDCVNKFVPVLLRKEAYQGLHQDTYTLLVNDLESHLNIIERKKIFRLLNSEHTKAQELGTVLVDKYIPSDTLSVPNIIRLANHEILAAREVAQRMFNENVARMRYEREDALRLMDSDWDDTRAFAFDYFRKNFRELDWTPELLVSICDSVRKDVSAFGRELITKFFKEQDGTQYLLKLSQHPTPELQLFASNYLERFASDDLSKLKKLEFYFITVLTQVNKGRVAKDRVLNFLRGEAMKSNDAAEIVAKILDNLSLTVAIGDKATCIEMMRDIHEKYPDIDVPISLMPVKS